MLKLRTSRTLLIGFALFAALAVALCISLIMQAHIHNEYARAEEAAREEVFQHMISMRDLFAYIDDPEVDIQYKLLPELKRHFTAIDSLNRLLRDGFEAEPVLAEEVTAGIQSAFDEYAAAYKSGGGTGLARDDLEAQVSTFAPMITKRYDKVDPNLENVVIIDGFKKN